MNLLELIDIKVTYRSTLNKLIFELGDDLSDNAELFDRLNEIEGTLDLLLLLERAINREYHINYVSKTESIADVYTYIDGLSEKINILNDLILVTKGKERSVKCGLDIHYKNIAQSTERYKILRSTLLNKVKDICKKVVIKDLKL